MSAEFDQELLHWPSPNHSREGAHRPERPSLESEGPALLSHLLGEEVAPELVELEVEEVLFTDEFLRAVRDLE